MADHKPANNMAAHPWARSRVFAAGCLDAPNTLSSLATCGKTHAAFDGRCIPPEPPRFAGLCVALRSKYTRASSPGGGSSLARLVSRAPPHRENWASPVSALTWVSPPAANPDNNVRPAKLECADADSRPFPDPRPRSSGFRHRAEQRCGAPHPRTCARHDAARRTSPPFGARRALPGARRTAGARPAERRVLPDAALHSRVRGTRREAADADRDCRPVFALRRRNGRHRAPDHGVRPTGSEVPGPRRGRQPRLHRRGNDPGRREVRARSDPEPHGLGRPHPSGGCRGKASAAQRPRLAT